MKKFFKNNIFYLTLFWSNYIFVSIIITGLVFFGFPTFLSLITEYYINKEKVLFAAFLGLILFILLVFEWFLLFKKYKKIKDKVFQKAGWKEYLKILFFIILNLVLLSIFVLSMFGKQ